jgi:hypothetical protein
MTSLRSALLLVPLTLGVASLVACSPPLESTDAGDANTSADATTDTTEIAADVVAMDGPSTCPTQDMAAFAAGTACPSDGQMCRYGYTRAECGGRTLTCTGGYWSEVHTDPQPACFMDGGTPADAGPFECGTETCDPSQFCVHQCSGIDLGPDAPSIAPHCGTPSMCNSGSGHAIGHDWYCDLCA